MGSSNCFPRTVLEAYGSGNVTEEQLAKVAEHVDCCTQCQSVLQSLSEADPLLPRLRQAVASTPAPPDGELERLMQHAKALGLDEADPSRWATTPGMTPGPVTQLDQYRLLEKIGQGGMGAVFKALHVRLEKVVAVKVLPPNRTGDPEAMARFLREIRAAGKLNHPNIVTATDAREVNGIHFLVMELIDGIDLARLTRRLGTLGVADACELVRQAAAGLEHAQEHGLVHRDIKPSNLMLCTDGRVKVLDLGLARLPATASASELSVASELTVPGQLMGTIDYMAPEQGSDATTVDIRADVYGLGCSLYHMLSGHPPFAGHSTLATKLIAHQTESPVPIGRVRPDIPETLARLLDRMLAKDRDRRPFPADVVRDLQPLARNADLLRMLASLRQAPDAGDAAKAEASSIRQRSTISANDSASAAPPVPFRARPWRLPTNHGALAVIVVLALIAAATYLTFHRDGQRNPDDRPEGKAPAKAADRRSRPIQSEKDVLSAIRKHLLRAPKADRPFQRFFTMTHLYNNDEQIRSRDLSLYGTAFTTLVNGLRRHDVDVELATIDEARAIYAVDLRVVGWDEPLVWKEALKANPYGLRHDRDSDEAMRELYLEVAELLDSPVVHVRADWFVAAVSRPPLLDAFTRGKAELLVAPSVVDAVKRYEKDLALEEAANELGIEPATLRTRITENPRLRELGLGPLVDGGTISRSRWSTQENATSLYQEVARALGLGTPSVAF